MRGECFARGRHGGLHARRGRKRNRDHARPRQEHAKIRTDGLERGEGRTPTAQDYQRARIHKRGRCKFVPLCID